MHIAPQPHNIVRATAQVGLLCETVIRDDAKSKDVSELTRDDVFTKIVYVSNVRYVANSLAQLLLL